jgi:hypothetical protein
VFPVESATRVPEGTAAQSKFSANKYLPPPSLLMLVLKSLMIIPRISTKEPGVPLPTTSNWIWSGVELAYLLITTFSGIAFCASWSSTARLKVCVAVPKALEAVTWKFVVPGDAGAEPVIRPVLALMANPAGKPVAENDVAGPVADTCQLTLALT